METLNLINAALSQDKEGFAAAFQAAIANKVTDALEVKKVEMASTIITPETIEVETNEVETNQSEIDGIDNSSAE
jgi:hypothetical protein